MNEIKIGEYVRWKTDRIFKVTENEVDFYNYIIEKEHRKIKHSPNIIDLIEERRYNYLFQR